MEVDDVTYNKSDEVLTCSITTQSSAWSMLERSERSERSEDAKVSMQLFAPNVFENASPDIAAGCPAPRLSVSMQSMPARNTACNTADGKAALINSQKRAAAFPLSKTSSADSAAGGPVLFGTIDSDESVLGSMQGDDINAPRYRIHTNRDSADSSYAARDGTLQPFSEEAQSFLEAREAAKRRNIHTTVTLAVVIGVIILAMVFWNMGGRTPLPSPLDHGCKVRCEGFNDSDATCRGTLYSLCCSKVGGAVFCSFPNARHEAWGSIIAQCPQCQSSCLQDAYFETGELFGDLASCAVG